MKNISPGMTKAASAMAKLASFSFTVPGLNKAWKPWIRIKTKLMVIKSQVFTPYIAAKAKEKAKFNAIFFELLKGILKATRANPINNVSKGMP